MQVNQPYDCNTTSRARADSESQHQLLFSWCSMPPPWCPVQTLNLTLMHTDCNRPVTTISAEGPVQIQSSALTDPVEDSVTESESEDDRLALLQQRMLEQRKHDKAKRHLTTSRRSPNQSPQASKSTGSRSRQQRNHNLSSVSAKLVVCLRQDLIVFFFSFWQPYSTQNRYNKK